MPDSLDKISVSLAEVTILPLVKRFFQANRMRAQAAKSDLVFIARLTDQQNNPIIGALRLCPVDSSWLLRSMVVDKNYQRQGIGHKILLEIKQELAEKKCFCYAYRHLQGFYQHAGFRCTELSEVPESIAQRFLQYQASHNEIILMQFITD